MTSVEDDSRLHEEALRWFERIYADGATFADFIAWEPWLEECPANAAAFDDVEMLPLESLSQTPQSSSSTPRSRRLACAWKARAQTSRRAPFRRI